MTSFLVLSNDKKKRQAYIQTFCEKQAIDRFDITIIEKEETSKNIQTIGIEEIKQMQKKIFLKPIKSKTKAIILEDAQLLTIEAQNALLKILEEPPEHTIIMVCAHNKESLLPTIISRCQIVQLETESLKLSEKERADLTVFIETTNQLTVGERLKKAEQLAKDKDRAIKWIEKMIIVMREETLHVILGTNEERTPESLTNNIKSFQRLHTLLKTTNVNPRLAIENTLLML